MNKLFLIVDKIKGNNLNTAVLDESFSSNFSQYLEGSVNSEMIEAQSKIKFSEFNTNNNLGYFYLNKKGEKHDKSVLNIGNTSTYREMQFSEDFQNDESKKLITNKMNKIQSSTELKNIYQYSSNDIAFLVHNKNFKLPCSPYQIALDKRRRSNSNIEVINLNNNPVMVHNDTINFSCDTKSQNEFDKSQNEFDKTQNIKDTSILCLMNNKCNGNYKICTAFCKVMKYNQIQYNSLNLLTKYGTDENALSKHLKFHQFEQENSLKDSEINNKKQHDNKVMFKEICNDLISSQQLTNYGSDITIDSNNLKCFKGWETTSGCNKMVTKQPNIAALKRDLYYIESDQNNSSNCAYVYDL